MASRFAGLPPVHGVRAAGGPPVDAMVSLRMADGGKASVPLRQVRGRQVVAAVPWPKTRSARGQAHYPGYPDGQLTLTAYGERFARDVRPPPWNHSRRLEIAKTTITEHYPERRPGLLTYPATRPPRAVQLQRNASGWYWLAC